MKKKELESEIERLKSELAMSKDAQTAMLQGGLEYKKRFQDAFMLLKEITGLNSHPQWLKIQDFIKQYEVINTLHYGAVVVPKQPAHHWACTGCDTCGSKGHQQSWF